MVNTGPIRDEVGEHQHLARLLSARDREWLRHMADVLESGAVILGMATRRREAVVPGRSGALLIRAPEGGSGQCKAAG
jgi:hypothetical protein